MDSTAETLPVPVGWETLISADWLLETLPWGVLVVDAHFIVRRLNQQAARWCGAPPAALLGQPLATVPLAATLRDVLLPLLNPGVPATHEVFLPAHAQWIAFTATAQPEGWVLYGQDITAQKQREQQYQALAKNTPDVLTRWTPDLRLCYANPALTAKVGAPLPALLGKTKREMGLPEQVAGAYMAALQRVFDTGQPQELFHPLPTPHGTMTYHSRLVPELRDGEIETVLGIARDLTELHQTQAETLHLRDALTQQATYKYQALFQTMEQLFCLLEVQFDDAGERAVDYRYLEVNPEFTRQSGMPADTVGQSIRALMPDLEPFWFDTFGQVARTGTAARFEREVPQLSGWFDAHAFRLGSPEACQVAVLFTNITARKQAEQRQQFLLHLTDALRQLADPLAIQREALAVLRAHLGGTRTLYAEALDQEGTMYISTENRDPGLVPMEGLVMRFQDFTPDGLAEAKAGRPLWRNDVLTEVHTPEQLAACATFGTRAWLMVPLVKNGRLVADLTVHSATAREWTAHDVALVQETTERTWAAVERAKAEETLRLHQQRTRIQKDAFQSAINGDALPTSLNLLLQMVKEQVGRGVRTAFYLAYPDGASLHAIAGAGDMPDTYTAALDGFPTGEASFCSGYAIAVGCPVHTSDVQKDAAWQPYRDLAAAHEFRASSSYPILTREGQAVGSVALYFAGVHEATPQEAAVAEAVAQAAGIILSRHAQTVKRAHVEQALRESEQRLQKALAIPTVGVIFFDLEGTIHEANAAFEHMSGYSRAELASGAVRWDVLTPPEFMAATHTSREELLAAGQNTPYEKQYIRPDGSRWWGLFAGRRLNDTECVEFVLDITARKQTEEALRASQAQLAELNAQLEQRVARRTQALQASRDLLQSVFDTNLIAMSVLEAVRDDAGAVQDFRLRLVNRELERQTNRRDLVGRLYTQEYPGIRDVGIFDLLLRTLATGEPQELEYHYGHEGFNHWFVGQYVKLGDGVVATNLDVTERKRAEQERNKNLRLLEQAEAVAGLGSWDYDLRSQAFHWSEGMYRLFGLPPGQPVEPAIYTRYVVEEDRHRAEQLVEWLTSGSGSFEATLHLRVDGQVKTVHLKAVVLFDEAGQPLRVLGVDLDLSELHRLEADNLRLRLTQQRALFEAVQAAQEAERRRMAESLHNGIGQILYATKLRLDRLHSPLLGTAPELLAAHREADQLLADAIRQTRALSHELVPLVLLEFGLPAALHDIATKMSSVRLHLHSQVALEEGAPPLPLPLQLAVYRMAQELVQNIVKHAAGATEASLELEATPEWVWLRVEDNGPGFADESPQPSGLGLRTIRDQVALLGGQLSVGNRLVGGAYVRIRLPLATLPPAP